MIFLSILWLGMRVKKGGEENRIKIGTGSYIDLFAKFLSYLTFWCFFLARKVSFVNNSSQRRQQQQ